MLALAETLSENVLVLTLAESMMEDCTVRWWWLVGGCIGVGRGAVGGLCCAVVEALWEDMFRVAGGPVGGCVGVDRGAVRGLCCMPLEAMELWEDTLALAEAMCEAAPRSGGAV